MVNDWTSVSVKKSTKRKLKTMLKKARTRNKRIKKMDDLIRRLV